MPLAVANAWYNLNAKYTGCTNLVVLTAYPVGTSWAAALVQGTCTGPA